MTAARRVLSHAVLVTRTQCESGFITRTAAVQVRRRAFATGGRDGG